MTDKTYSQAQQTNIMAAVAGAFMRLRDGSNRVRDFNDLAAAFNIGLVRSEQIGQQAVEVFRAAQQALLRADQFYESMHAYIFTQSDLVDLAKGVAAYAEVLQESSEQQITDAIKEAERRLAVGVHARIGNTH